MAASAARGVERLVAHLPPGEFEVVATTGPSWGSRRDEPVRPFTAAEMAEDIASQLAVRDQRVHLVGFSMGGVVAFELALMQRLPLASLTLVEATISPLLRLTEHQAEADEHAQACSDFAAAVSAGEQDAAARAFATVHEPGYWDALPEQARASLNRYAGAAARDGLMESQRRYTEAEVASVAVPTVAVYGSETRARLRHIAEAVARFVPNGQVFVIDGANHDMLVTHPDQVAAANLHAIQLASEDGRRAT